MNRLVRIVAASLSAALLVDIVYHLLQAFLHPSRMSYFIELSICLPLAFAGFILGFRLFQVQETEMAFEAFRSPVRKVMRVLRAKIRE